MEYQGQRVEIVKIGWKPSEECPVVGDYVVRVLSVLKGRTPEGKIVDLLEKKE